MPLGHLLVAAVVILTGACGPEPVSMEDVPVFPGATPVKQGQNELVDLMVGSIKESSSAEGVDVEVRLYALPGGVAMEQLRGFYDRELAAADWESESGLTSEIEYFRSVGWSRRAAGGDQVLVVGHITDIAEDSTYLMLGLFSQ
jgi:hypothetical protein